MINETVNFKLCDLLISRHVHYYCENFEHFSKIAEYYLSHITTSSFSLLCSILCRVLKNIETIVKLVNEIKND